MQCLFWSFSPLTIKTQIDFLKLILTLQTGLCNRKDKFGLKQFYRFPNKLSLTIYNWYLPETISILPKSRICVFFTISLRPLAFYLFVHSIFLNGIFLQKNTARVPHKPKIPYSLCLSMNELYQEFLASIFVTWFIMVHF